MNNLREMTNKHRELVNLKNSVNANWYNGVVQRYNNPVLTANHVPLNWRFDFNQRTNPFGMERLGVNSLMNPGAIFIDGRYLLMVRIEGNDRKSFFAVAESGNGIDSFSFWKYPVTMPELSPDETNLYDMRLTQHQDGWIYGLFCVEKKGKRIHEYDESSAVASCGVARTRDLINFERLPDLVSKSPQQRNVVLHPEFVNGRYMLYTRPLNSFMSTGAGPGIGYAYCDSMENPIIDDEQIFDERVYHTVKEGKNGLGPAPLKTAKGWLHLCHGVRECAAGMRYVLYLVVSDLTEPSRIISRPGGYFLAPKGKERVGDVSNVLFANGWLVNDNNEVYIYYASSDQRIHVATSTVERLLDYAINTPEDPLRSSKCVEQRIKLINDNAPWEPILEFQ
jgi:4-O-beta-D-mannosyl-D-glucose phosphorylase